MNCSFAMPVIVAKGYCLLMVADAEAAAAFLSDRWPRYGPRHAEAAKRVRMAIDGDATPLEAMQAFVAAGREAEILVEGYVLS